MVEKIAYIIFWGLSLYFYFFAPVKFSPVFCTYQFYVYLLVASFAIFMNKRRYGTFFNATNVFLVLYMMATYLHAVYYYKDEGILPSFAFGYNRNIVNRAICMAQIGISSYLIGTSLVKRCNITNKVSNTRWITLSLCRFFQNFSLLIALGWFVYIFFFFKRSNTYVIVYPRLTLMLSSIIVFTLALTVMYDKNRRANKKGVLEFITRNKCLLIAVLLFLIPFFYLNSRTNPAAIALIFLMFVHFYYKKLSFKFLLVFGVISFVLMAIISYSRISSVNTSTAGIFDVVSFGIDFLINNEHATTFLLQDYMLNIRNLYDGIDYPSINGYFWGMTYFPIVFSAIPFLPTLLLSMFGHEKDDFDTSKTLTDFNDAGYGLGTHIVGDLYMNGGVIAVILGMFILGFIVAMSERRKTFCWLLVSCSIYGSIMMLPRINFLAWFVMFSMLFFLYLLAKAYNQESIRKRNSIHLLILLVLLRRYGLDKKSKSNMKISY